MTSKTDGQNFELFQNTDISLSCGIVFWDLILRDLYRRCGLLCTAISLDTALETMNMAKMHVLSRGLLVSTILTSKAFAFQAQQSLVPMKEIASVKILDPEAFEPPFASKLSDILPKDADLYVTFEQGGEAKGRSITFDDSYEAYTNLPLRAREADLLLPVKCQIKQKRGKFRRDKVLFTADLALGDDKYDEETGMGEVTGLIRDRNNDSVGLVLSCSTFNTEWNSENVGQNNPTDQKMDRYFRIFLALLGEQLKSLDLGGSDILQKPEDKANAKLEMKSLLGGLFEYPTTDEFLPIPATAKYILPALNKFLPYSGRTVAVTDHSKAINGARLSLQTGVKSPYEGRWKRPLSDASLHRVYFSSFGMFYVKKDPETDGYVSDLTYFNELDYKPTFEKLGCKTYFDSNGDVTQIQDSDGKMYRPGEVGWEWAKLKSHSAMFTYASLEHITNYHFTWACDPGAALRMFLPSTHPIRMAFSAHFFRTHYTCTKAQDSLLSEVGVLGRSLPFAYEGGLEKAFIDLISNFTYMTYPDELESQGIKDCSFHIGSIDGIEQHRIMTKYVSYLFDEVYRTEGRFQQDDAMRDAYKYMVKRMNGLPAEYTMDNVKAVWGEILFRVTGAHTCIGNAAAYALDPFMVNFRMLEDDKGSVKSSMECNAAVIGITGITIPNNYPKLCQDWSQVLSDPKSEAYATLRADLDELSKTIDTRNKSGGRRFVNRDFHPDYVAVSVFS